MTHNACMPSKQIALYLHGIFCNALELYLCIDVLQPGRVPKSKSPPPPPRMCDTLTNHP